MMEWLDIAGFEPVPMLDLSSLATSLAAKPLESLVADAALVPDTTLPTVVQMLGRNRPLVLLGAPGTQTSLMARHARWLDRPANAETLSLTILLALAEGRPARQSPRKHLRPLPATVDGNAAQVLDVSYEGVRLEVAGVRPGALSPVFTLNVPTFGVVRTVRRVWARAPGDRRLWCGGRLVNGSDRAAGAWRQLVETAPSVETHAILIR
jgi:hypothetical protein